MSRNALTLGGAGLLLALCAVLFLTLGARGNWEFVLWLRGGKLISLLVVAAAVSTATLLFQAVTRNHILTPSIMGFDALYMMILAVAVFGLGGMGLRDLPEWVVFTVNLGVLTGASVALFGTLLGQYQADLMRMILTGIVFGILFRSLTSFLLRMIDPNEFSFVQVRSFARFGEANPTLLTISVVLCLAILVACWFYRFRLDVLALGFEIATSLGEPVARRQIRVLILISGLVAVSTALVGPVAFLGLLVVSLARLVTPDPGHAILLPLSALIAGIVLVGGQTILERVLGFTTPLSAVIDFVGGVVFLGLILTKGAK